MKKLLFTIALGLSLCTNANSSKYQISDDAMEEIFAASTEITLDQKINANLGLATDGLNYSEMAAGGEKKRGAFLALNFFCGGLALHRYYMGLGDSSAKYWMWAFYFLVPVAGGVDACVDFCWVLFKKDALSNYADNDAIFVWL